VEQAHKAFISWLTAREENTKLALSGDTQKVKESVLSTGTVGILRDKMLAKIQIIENYAVQKGDNLYSNSLSLSKLLNQRLFLLVGGIILLSLLIGFYLLRNIRNPIDELTDAANRFQEGDFNVRSTINSKNEFGTLAASFNKMVESIQTNLELREKTSKLADAMLIEENAHNFFKAVLPELSGFTNSQMAAVYLLSEDKQYYEHFESFGLDVTARIKFNANSFEGEFGAAISTAKIQHIKNIPVDTHFVFQTVSGKFIPREIITIPILVGKEVVAIISLASIRSYSAQSNQLIESIYNSLTARIEGVLAYRELNHLNERLEIQSAELAKAGLYTRTLLEANVDPFFTIGEDGIITDINKPTENITGLTRSDLIGSDFSNYFKDPELSKEIFLQVFREGIVRNFELAMKHVDGRITPVLYNASVYRDENGNVVGIFAAARDISQRKRNEMRLKELNDTLTIRSEHLEVSNMELEAQKKELSAQSAELTEQNRELEMQKKMLSEANVLKTNFLSNMSHELRTPLNSVIALSGVLNRRLSNQIPAEEYSYLEVIERNGKNLLLLINDILDISRIESGREEIEIINFNANNLIAEIVSMILPQTETKELKLIHSGKEAELLLTSDLNKCRHILQNLIGNAVKFTEKGTVEIKSKQSADKITITITDTGIGIAENHMVHIFDEFRQADGSTSRRFGGTGLGLAIAKKSANLLGGTVTVKSELGKGSAFTLTLPLKYSAENRIIEEAAISHFNKVILPATVKPVGGKTILLVDDSEPAIIQIKDFLEECGYQILVANDGASALDIISQTIPDAMILDLMMPDIDGFEVLRSLRNAEPTANVPVLVLTAKHITKDDLKELKRNNIHQLIQKGDVKREELISAVASMVVSEEKVQPVSKHRFQPIDGKPVVLVVEDNPDNMTTVKAILANDFKIIEAVAGEEGIQMAKKYRPNLILMDIALPSMDGIEAFKTIRADVELEYIPVIALTASAMTTDRETILAHGFDAYIAKPIDDNEFYDTINEVLFGS
jgi:PAS domain S-box-containing protein